MMVGDEPPTRRPATPPGAARGEPRVLEIEGLHALDDARHAGAVDGADADGARRARSSASPACRATARRSWSRCWPASARPRAGDGRRAAASPTGATRDEMRGHKVRCLPEEPLRNACVGMMSVAENIGFRALRPPPVHAACGRWSAARRCARRARALIAEYGIRTPGPDAPIAQPLGRQRAARGAGARAGRRRRRADRRQPLLRPRLRGGGRDPHAGSWQARNRGAAVLLISADLDEIFALADRIVVMSDGQAVHETPIASADLGVIGRHMAGHADGPKVRDSARMPRLASSAVYRVALASVSTRSSRARPAGRFPVGAISGRGRDSLAVGRRRRLRRAAALLRYAARRRRPGAPARAARRHLRPQRRAARRARRLSGRLPRRQPARARATPSKPRGLRRAGHLAASQPLARLERDADGVSPAGMARGAGAGLRRRRRRDALARRAHRGPLSVQRPFFPRGAPTSATSTSAPARRDGGRRRAAHRRRASERARTRW